MINKIENKKIIIAIIAVLAMIILIIVNINKNNESVIIDNTEDVHVEKTEIKEKNIMVHITGCVNNPGVIEIKDGSRMVDVITSAGGFTQEADITKINLVYVVKDAQKIYIPSIYDTEEAEYISTENGENVIIEYKEKGGSTMININSATQTELEQLPGIGPSTAFKIIKYREQNGKFENIEQIKEVPGIGDAKFEGIKDMLEV